MRTLCAAENHGGREGVVVRENRMERWRYQR